MRNIRTGNYYLTNEPVDFYIYDYKTSTSYGWVKGNCNLWHSLHNAFKRSKKEFDLLCNTLIIEGKITKLN